MVSYKPSPIRTVPSASESHRICRHISVELIKGLAGLLCLHLLAELTAGRELHPAPKVSKHHYATKHGSAASAGFSDFLPDEILPRRHTHASYQLPHSRNAPA